MWWRLNPGAEARLVRLSWDNERDEFTPPTHLSFCLQLCCDVSRPLPNASSLTVDFLDSKTVETNFYNYSVCGILLLKQQNKTEKKDKYPGSFFCFLHELNLRVIRLFYTHYFIKSKIDKERHIDSLYENRKKMLFVK